MKTDPILKEIRDLRDARYTRLGNDSQAWLNEIRESRQALERQGWVFIDPSSLSKPATPPSQSKASAKPRTSRKAQTA